MNLKYTWNHFFSQGLFWSVIFSDYFGFNWLFIAIETGWNVTIVSKTHLKIRQAGVEDS